MRYVKARYNEYQRDLIYRIYITDSLYYMGQRRALTKKWYDIINPPPVETRTGDEIVADISAKIRGTK